MFDTKLRPLALDARRLAFIGRHLRHRGELLFEQGTDAVEFAVDQLDLPGLGEFLGRVTLDLLPELVHAFAQPRLVAGQCDPAKLEQPLLAGDHRGDLGLVHPGDKHGRQRHPFNPVALGLETGFAGIELVQALCHEGEVGARNGVAELDQEISGLDPVAIAHEDLADSAAGRMLHLLLAGLDDHRAMRN